MVVEVGLSISAAHVACLENGKRSPSATVIARYWKFIPISQWDIIGSFDTATACEKPREFMLDKISALQFQAWTKANAEKHGQKFDKKAGDQRTLSSRCVSSDDPRLKSK